MGNRSQDEDIENSMNGFTNGCVSVLYFITRLGISPSAEPTLGQYLIGLTRHESALQCLGVEDALMSLPSMMHLIQAANSFTLPPWKLKVWYYE